MAGSRRRQACRAGRKCGWCGPLAWGGERLQLQLPTLEIRHVVARQPAGMFRGHREARLLHAQRLEDPGPEEIFQRLTRGARDQDAEHERAGIVLPPLTGLRHQWQRPETPDPLVRVMRRTRVRRDRKSTRLNSSHVKISYAVFCLKT